MMNLPMGGGIRMSFGGEERENVKIDASCDAITVAKRIMEKMAK